MLRRMLVGAVAWLGLGLALPAAGATINLTVSDGGLDSDLTRTCSSFSCSNGSTIWSLASGEEFAATGTITIDTTLNTMTISLAVATSVLDRDPAPVGGLPAQPVSDGGATSLAFTGGLYTATVAVTNVGGGTWQINAAQTGSVSFSLVQAVGAGAGAPLSFGSLALAGSCNLTVSNTGSCGLRFGSIGSPSFQVSGAGFGSYNRYVRHALDVTVVPEPGTLALLGLGLAGLALRSRRA